jgi:hypothetical protein
MSIPHESKTYGRRCLRLKGGGFDNHFYCKRIVLAYAYLNKATGFQIKPMFGQWKNNLTELGETFRSAQPFEHVVIPNFFSEEVARAIHDAFPAVDETWIHYDNPIEQKYALNDFKNPEIERTFAELQSSDFVECCKTLSGIDNLECDPHLHGAGLHAYPSGGKLDVHLDYSIHPISKKERRINLIIYMNKDWKESYGGHLQLWNDTVTEKTTVITPSFNTAVLFRTSDISYHGVPTPIACPPGEYRKSLAIYYVSEPRDAAVERHKAEFVPLPHQSVDERLRRLYAIRKERILTAADLADWENWREEGNGFW